MRQLEKKDAADYMQLVADLEAESDFLLYEKGERKADVERVTQMIRAFEKQRNSAIWCAEEKGRLVGHVTCIGGQAKRNVHVTSVVVGVLKEAQGRGVASRLLDQVKKWAKEAGVRRIELTVMVHNEAAISLYKKAGFRYEGTKERSLFVNDDFMDEEVMALLID
ncbi:GNAT family N-acetyltransferase [Halobacillus fulvus]|nr:GNAT family N-acetyltransferase [Halobacillus fulvus]